MSYPPEYTRDFQGYGACPPNPEWPNQARVAISLVLNIEAGAELNLADGDERNNSVYEINELVEEAPDFCMSSHFDFGPRAGYWRIARLLERYKIPASASCCGRSLERAPWLGRDMVERGWEVSCHSYRWERHSEMSLEKERLMIGKAVESIEKACGERPVGWHTRGAPSVNTRRLLADEFDFLYDSDAYDDDLPYMREVAGKPFVVMPYAFDTNDMGFMPGGKFSLAHDFAECCINAFDVFFDEGEKNPKMMSIGLHPRLIGRASRIVGLQRFLEHVRNRGGAWFARRNDIAQHWKDKA
jgi:allantoinase